MDELNFWRECCRRGITICEIPRPMREDQMVWLVEKHDSFRDRTKWKAQHTFDSLDEVFYWVGGYLANGSEPKVWSERAKHRQ
jgi:hypothetical protein